MIIWTRWGIPSFPGFGIGVAPALGSGRLLGIDGGPAFGAPAFLWAAAVNLGPAHRVHQRPDKPQQG